jgi:hypothetical protein
MMATTELATAECEDFDGSQPHTHFLCIVCAWLHNDDAPQNMRIYMAANGKCPTGICKVLIKHVFCVPAGGCAAQ